LTLRPTQVLGERYDAVFAAPPPAGGDWLRVPAAGLAALAAGLDDPAEADLRAALDALRPRFDAAAERDDAS
jgi:hypothetical protein